MNEKDFELAAKLTEMELTAALARNAAAVPNRPLNFDGCCIQCGEELSDSRAATGAITCYECQTEIEKRQVLRSGY